jgi:hypothetical protein
MPNGAEQKEREMPKGARCRTAQNAERREMPNGATARDAEQRECQTARNGGGQRWIRELSIFTITTNRL